MNLLLRAVVALRQWATPSAVFGSAIVGALLAIEVAGRRLATTDIHDLLGLGMLIAIGVSVLSRHRREPMAWFSRLAEPLIPTVRFIAEQTFQVGLDMRVTPPVKRGIPPIVRWTGIGLAGAALMSVASSRYLPNPVCDFARQTFYLGYLALLGVFWLSLLLMIGASILIPLAMIHDHCVTTDRNSGHRNRRREVLYFPVYVGGLFLLGALCPLWVAPLVSLALFALYSSGMLAPSRFAVQLLWRPRGSIQVRSMSWGQWVACEFGLIGLAVLALTFAACGDMIWGLEHAGESMPLTAFMGILLAWLGPGFMAILCTQMILGRLRDPARPAPPTVHIRDHQSGARRREIARLFRSRGWRVSFAEAADRKDADATIDLAAQAPPVDVHAREWPLVLTPSELERDGLFVRLNRRSEIQRRRRFFAGLETLLKGLPGKSRDGNGYWLAPHLWFISSMLRDTRGDDTSDFDFADDTILSPSIGLPYHRVFSRAVRRHLFDVLRAVQIDLIFIEDGVSFKRLRRALRALFEVYDVHSGRKPAEEIDFRGLPGIRVLIHDYQFDEPFQSSMYPEPKYDQLGRARILHVFRDRGGDEEVSETPYDFDHRPAPMGFPTF